MTPDFKKMFKVTLKRDGKDISSNQNNVVEKTDQTSSLGLPTQMLNRNAFVDIAQVLLRTPYKSEFVQFGSNCRAELDSTPGRKDCVRYYNALSEEIGQVYLQNNRVVATSNSEQYGYTYIHRSENFLNSGFLKSRMLRVYTKGRFRSELTHFCYELYNKDGQMEFCTTNINDPSISNHEGDFVRYIYENGKLYSKEVYAGKEYKFGKLGNNSFYPPVITSIGGNLNVRYVCENGHLVKETGFQRTENPLMIIGNKNGAETFVYLNGGSVNRCIVDDMSVLNDTMCRVHMQENLFKNSIRKYIEDDAPLNF
jgi:hypothetical protein